MIGQLFPIVQRSGPLDLPYWTRRPTTVRGRRGARIRQTQRRWYHAAST